jgi:predicted transcriptional regulator
LSLKEKEIVEILENGGLTISEIIKKSNLEIGQLLSMLSHLEIKGVIFNQGGKFYLAK